jgi:hypothetical protein
LVITAVGVPDAGMAEPEPVSLDDDGEAPIAEGGDREEAFAEVDLTDL